MAARPLLSIRPATADDVPLIRQLIAELAEYERLADAQPWLRTASASPAC